MNSNRNRIMSRPWAIAFCAIFLVNFLSARPTLGELAFGVPEGDFKTAEDAHKIFGPLIQHLEKETGEKITLAFAGKPKDTKLKMESGEIDILLTGASYYVQLSDVYPELQYVSTSKSKSSLKPFYYGYILAHKDSGAKKLSDLKGKSFAFTSQTSSSGYKYPMVLFKQKKIDPEKYFSKVEFLKKHPIVTDAIAQKKVDAGATWDENLADAEAAHGKIFTKIAKIGPIVSDAVSLSHKVTPEMKKKIEKALAATPKSVIDSKEFYYAGFQTMKDKDYDLVRKVNKLPTKADKKIAEQKKVKSH